MKTRGKSRHANREVAAAVEISQEERALFAAAMADVQPLAGPVRVPVVAQPSRVRPATTLPIQRLTVDWGETAQELEVERLGEQIMARARDVNLKLVKQLKQGDPGPQARLDLHGRTASVARDMLGRFVASALSAGRSCVLVVHGRGHHSAADGPVIKNVVIEALASQPLCQHILAFASAPRSLGGEGAMLVRLRRAR